MEIYIQAVFYVLVPPQNCSDLLGHQSYSDQEGNTIHLKMGLASDRSRRFDSL